MAEYLLPSLINGVIVGLGVFLLWTLTKWVPEPMRVRYAAVVGGVAGGITLVVTSLIAAMT